MTFIAAVTSGDTIWLVADRRLSRLGRRPKDDARKIVFLETTDGVAILGYSGLGATPAGTEPSDWMGRVLRGRNWPLEQCFAALTEAMKAEMPKHLRRTAIRDIASHVVIAPAFVGGHARVYSIDMTVSAAGRPLGVRHTRWTGGQPGVDQPPRVVFTGSGAMHVPPALEWFRQLLRLVKAHDKGRVSAYAVADALARLSYQVHQRDPYTGPNSIVAWRYCRSGRHKGGGAQAFYDRTTRIRGGASIPTIARGRDMGEFIRNLLPFIIPQLEAVSKGDKDPGIDVKAMTDAVNKLPTTPDEALK